MKKRETLQLNSNSDSVLKHGIKNEIIPLCRRLCSTEKVGCSIRRPSNFAVEQVASETREAGLLLSLQLSFVD